MLSNKQQSCNINGIHYVSESEASRVLGINLTTLRIRLRSSNFPGYKSKHHKKIKRRKQAALLFNAVKKVKQNIMFNRQSCKVNGIHYESESEASRVLDIDLMTLRIRLRSSNFPGYKSKYQKKIKRRKRIASISCTVKGVKYASISKVARKFKRSYNTILKRLQSFDYPDYICDDIPKVTKPSKPIKYNYKVKDKKYRTLQDIADVEGLTKERIRQKMNDPSYKEYKRL